MKLTSIFRIAWIHFWSWTDDGKDVGLNLEGEQFKPNTKKKTHENTCLVSCLHQTKEDEGVLKHHRRRKGCCKNKKMLEAMNGISFRSTNMTFDAELNSSSLATRCSTTCTSCPTSIRDRWILWKTSNLCIVSLPHLTAHWINSGYCKKRLKYTHLSVSACNITSWISKGLAGK